MKRTIKFNIKTILSLFLIFTITAVSSGCGNDIEEEKETAIKNDVYNIYETIKSDFSSSKSEKDLVKILTKWSKKNKLTHKVLKEGDEEYEGDNSLLRSLHESDITKGKLINLAIIGQALGPDGSVNVTITEDEADAWLSGINDLRLYLSAIDADDPVRREERDNLVDWLAYNQGTLLDAMGHDIDMQ